MKKIDIEDLDRRMPYEMPKDFFAEMQKNVLREISEKKKTKFTIKRTYWAIAASVAIIFGTGFLLLRNHQIDRPSTASIAQSVAQTEAKEPLRAISKTASVAVEKTVQQNTVATASLHNVTKEDLPSAKIVRKATVKKMSPVEKMYNDAVNNLTSQELAEQSRRYEMDTYLDLY